MSNLSYLIIVSVAIFGFAECGKPFCKYGSVGTCSAMNDYACAEGSYCNRPPTSLLGLCCRRRPVASGSCPPPSGLHGICVFDPTRNCLEDWHCPKDYLCCSEGCGKVCKHRKTDVEYPGKLTYSTSTM